jgi:TRAP-type mannitol/chloroaromatic compound transport system permease small subunit
MTTFARLIANILMATMILYLIHRYFMFWHTWPNFTEALAGISGKNTEVSKSLSYAIIVSFLVVFVVVIWHALLRKSASLMDEADRYAGWSAYIIRFAFWSVFLVGIVDTTISALRVENAMAGLLGKSLDTKLGLATFRGLYVHYPLLALSAVIAAFTRNLSFIWLAFLVVLAEFTIVITRFVFSYEQSYMGDLVRFWYAALFLFASSYTFIEEGHVRVDVIYANMKVRTKAWVNTIGCLALGIPLCFTILLTGLGSKFSSLSSPIINFEISQSGFGLYVKYLMAGFLIIFAVSMAIQFISYFLRNVAMLLGDERAPMHAEGEH